MDQRQRDIATHPEGSYLVRAPAGSGKTSLLTARYLRLLALVEAPEEILAITFTRKAAAEMRARILKELREAEAGTKTGSSHAARTRELAMAALQRDREKQWGILDSPRRLRVETIDAFEASLVRRLPLLSQLGLAPPVAEQPAALYGETVREALRGMTADTSRDALIELLCLFDNNLDLMSNSLAALLAKRDQWLPAIGANPLGAAEAGELRSTLEANLRALVAPAFDRLVTSLPVHLGPELAWLARYAATNLSADDPHTSLLATLRGWPPAESTSLPEWRGLGAWLLTNNDSLRKTVTIREGFPKEEPAVKNRMIRLLSVLSEYPEFVSALNGVRKLPDPSYTDAQWRVIEALFRFLRSVVPELHVQFALRREVDFAEVALRAIRALETPDGVPSLLAERLDARIQHLLVDEFQDTSVLQMELLRKLTENWTRGDGRTLFLVGDPMQSIYGWRNARVDLFLRAWQGSISGLPDLEPLQLQRNFRSRRNLIETFNEWLKPHFPKEADASSGAVDYADAHPDPSETDTREDRIRCRAFLSDSLEAEAEWIAGEIARIRAAEPADARAASIGVLFRKGANAAAVGRALNARGIHFQAIDVEPLGSLPVIQDLLSLWNAIGSPEDRLAWFSVLRAPWNALTLREIEALTSIASKRETIWRTIHRELDTRFSEEARVRLRRTVAIFEKALEWRGRMPAAQLLRTLWHESGASRYHADARSQTAARQFFRLLDRLDESGDLRLASALEEALSTLYAPPDPDADDTLQLLTIHKAKGLEFDVVFVPYLNAGIPPGDTPPLAWEEISVASEGGGEDEVLVLAPRHAIGESSSAISGLLKKRREQREKHERLRVLYVAMTRAKDELYLSATIDPRDAIAADELKPKSNSYLALLWEQFQGEFERAFEDWQPAGGVDGTKQYPLLRRLAAEELPELPVESPKEDYVAAESALLYRPRGVFETAETAAGTVFHRLMERMNSSDALAGASAHRDQLLPLVREELRALLPEEPVLDPIAARVIQALTATAASEIGQWIFHPDHQEVKSEQAVGYFEGTEWKTSRIDRLFRDSAGALHVVDFKLVDAEVRDPAAFLAEQYGLYAKQVEHYARLLQLQRAEPVTLTLYFPLQDLQARWQLPPHTRTA
ncbi:MAG: UvrD-helicase domain-containing protein [Bryobacterales bacterium]|nr:UvrD-helicase domain-containing protein [Bryobacterales bacterium]